MTLLALDRVTVRYGERLAVGPATLELRTGGLVGLVGPNGAGKSSLIKAAAGVIAHDGAVLWNGEALRRKPARERARIVAYLPQTQATYWPIKAADVVALGRMPHRAFGERPTEADRLAVSLALERCDATAFTERRVDQLSGGERARVLLARALAVGAPVLLVDEPIQSLDPYHQLEIMTVLRDHARAGRLVVAVLHDLALAARFCTRLIMLDEGTVVADGAPEAVLTAPALERHYRVRPLLARHDGEPLVVPWTPIGRPSAERR